MEDRLCVVWDRALLSKIPENIPVLAERGAVSNRDGIESDSPRTAISKILPFFDPREGYDPGIHPSAVVENDSFIGAGAYIGPCCVISKGARIGDRTVLQANVFVGRGAVIGSDTRIEACTAIHDFARIGSGVILHSGVAVGCDGFGHVSKVGGGWGKIPQIGTVIIEDDVEIGANCTVDRATFGQTRVRRGTKLGCLLHIAHNCDIGEDCVIAGCCAIGGSVKIGRGATIAGMVGISDHVTIGEGVTIAGKSGVTKDIKAGSTISGFPARDHRTENRFQVSLRRVADNSERLTKLEKLIEKMESEGRF
jgi:UDP-3-O-[3-hydroxymyristoyl] glucosamine N-acyltransferase